MFKNMKLGIKELEGNTGMILKGKMTLHIHRRNIR